MAVREIIEIDEELCDGCGDCITACAEGALAVIDGKARLIKDSYCDGFGACIGDCPRGAITIIRRESDEFDEEAVSRHLAARDAAPPIPMAPSGFTGGCPGSRAHVFGSQGEPAAETVHEESQLRHWPVQLHLVSPQAPFFKDSDVLLAADCVAFSVGSFHGRFLRNRSLAIACPKLDSNQDVYLEKLTAMIDDAAIRSLNVMVMEVPCCSGLVRLAKQAGDNAARKVPIKCLVVGVRGQIVAEHEVA